jgi:hypothetical protein
MPNDGRWTDALDGGFVGVGGGFVVKKEGPHRCATLQAKNELIPI